MSEWKQLNIRVAAERFDGLKSALKEAASRERITQAEVVEKALVALANPGLEITGEAKTILAWWAKQDGVTETEVIKALLRARESSRAAPEAQQITNPTSSQVPSTSAAPRPQAKDPMPSPEQRKRLHDVGEQMAGGYDATCSHCGNGFQIPAGRPPSTLCGDCFGAGHRNISNCFKCREREHFAKKASQDKTATAAGRDDIDFTVFND